MANIFKKLEKNFLVNKFTNASDGKFIVDDILSSAFIVSSSYLTKKQKYLLICPNLYKAQLLYSSLLDFVGDKNVSLFPADELIRVESLTQNYELSSQRVYTLFQICNNDVDIVVANLAGCIRYLPSPEEFKQNIFKFQIGDKINIKDIRLKLIRAGYHLVNKIDQSLQFAIRGDIIDIFSLNLEKPVRIELFDDEIESIRYFEISTQVSTTNIESVIILPASEMLFTNEEINDCINKLNIELEKYKKALSSSNFEILENNIEILKNKLLMFENDYDVYKYFKFFKKNVSNIFKYCKDYQIVLVDEEAVFSENSLLNFEAGEFKKELLAQHSVIDKIDFYLDIKDAFTKYKYIGLCEAIDNFDNNMFKTTIVQLLAKSESEIIDIIKTYLNREYDVMICLNSLDKINSVEKILESNSLNYDKYVDWTIPSKNHISINVKNLPYGLVFEEEKIVILTDKELFKGKIHSYRYSSKFKEGTILKSYEELEPGDYVVHEYQGIGQFLEINTLEVDGVHKDYLKLLYANDEYLYVPLSQFQLIRKYMAREGVKPKLTRLKSKDWEKTKQKIQEKINDLANRLFNLYEERSKVDGFSFQNDDEIQLAFENDFPYSLTKDQETSLEEIKKDMESPIPMDRLLCGDVGFGKTEIAFRAAFKAILSGKQVAILCPTTILARQHYQLAKERFTKYDVKIAIFSRLVPISKQKEYIKSVRDGTIHLIIGTHRLLSKDIVFNNLGLLIIDEEQRFGVEQKEKIKELKNNVDVLTLSATPIPRTLQISLLGMRSLSLINTPIENRMPVQTYVLPYKENVVKELILRELSRNGQVFYLYNRIESLYRIATKLQSQIPNARIATAHGQMSKNEIEDVMLKFYNGEIDVLVCTSIIENGIDVSNANMIIVENADMYGLSQLYQIKGRVGRSDRIAYAYLFYNGKKELNDNAKKRLKAIKEFASLGSGYKIAQRDLLIRGAGDILGPNQAGYIDSIGLDLYMRLLNDAVKKRISPDDLFKDKNANKQIEIDLNLDAYIDDNYAKGGDKIELYQQIQNCADLDSLVQVEGNIRDIYGPMPKNVQLLFEKQEIDILVKESQIENINIMQYQIELILGKKYLDIKGIGNILFEKLMPYVNLCKINYLNGILKITLKKNNQWIENLKNILKDLIRIVR